MSSQAWEALERLLRAVSHISRANAAEGHGRVRHLHAARQLADEAYREIEAALVEAENEASDGHDGDGDGGGAP